ncbi:MULTISPECIES: urease accessory protein UreD [Winslowiella]|uniref:urease accessory protein UreD n=1 Tax=Winslowiella TaxID=2997349 RepID=UPI0028BE7BD3|nr:urease accessory protein UreD [Winslowiella toletana]WNN45489.1 urease accessory protein UreD [Winslowiella toletana]
MQINEEAPLALDSLSLGALAPELANYQHEPPQMASAAVGKHGYLRLRFAKRGAKSTLHEMERKVPLLVQKALYWDEEMPFLPCVTMISTSGCILQGDRLTVEIDVDAGACAHVTTQSATKVHSMDNNFAAQTQHIRVGKQAYLEFMPDQLIPHRNSRFISDTVIECDSTATVIYSEILMSGRKYHHQDERFGFDVYSSRITAKNELGNTLFNEKLVLTPKERPLDVVGVMGKFDVYGNVIVLTPKEHQDEILAQSPSFYSEQLCYGVSRLPNESGLIFKVLSCDSTDVKNAIREFWQKVRKVTTGYSLPTPFIWKV